MVINLKGLLRKAIHYSSLVTGGLNGTVVKIRVTYRSLDLQLLGKWTWYDLTYFDDSVEDSPGDGYIEFLDSLLVHYFNGSGSSKHFKKSEGLKCLTDYICNCLFNYDKDKLKLENIEIDLVRNCE